MAGRSMEVQYGAFRSAEQNQEETQRQFTHRLQAGLCVNCRHQADCVYALNAPDPVFECELHECGPSGKLQLLAKKAAPPQVSGEAGQAAPLGLCVTCENLNGCGLPRSAGGVWACEEYS